VSVRVAAGALIAAAFACTASQEVARPDPPAPAVVTPPSSAPDAAPAPGESVSDAGGSDAGIAPAPIVESAAKDTLLGGMHWRLVTQDGVLHVWRPGNYSARSAATILYVHGYYTDVDGAWRAHQLARQFRQSGRNALFIAPEAPSGGPQDVQFKDLGALLQTVTRLSGQAIPAGPVIAVGHSGAYRTLALWLAWPELREVVLLDAMYWNEPQFEAWAARAPDGPVKKLVVVGYETAVRSEAFCGRFLTVARRNDIPRRLADFTRWERQAELLYIQSQDDHMALVTQGRVIPVLLQLPLPK
jgi:hypothetical protein